MKIVISIIFLIISSLTFSQKDSDKILFERGKTFQDAFFETDLVDILYGSDTISANVSNRIFIQLQEKAIENYNKLVQNYPNSEFYLESLYLKAEAEYSINNYKGAKKDFLEVVQSNSYLHKSLIKLAFLYLDEKDYKKALDCVEKRRKLEMKFTCGNEYKLVQTQLKYIEEQCELGLKK